jgi:two-component system, OmpR family, response regulator
MSAVLLIEDARDTAAEIDAELTRLGFTVDTVTDGAVGLGRALDAKWDALIVDRMLPGMDGLSLVRALRARNVMTPALILSALDQVGDRVIGLRAGGDDYLVKPFALAELAARLEALLRRPVDGKQTVLHVGSLRLDLVARKAWRSGRPLDLLGREFQLLEYLAARAGQTITREMILSEIFGYRFEIKSNLVDVHMGRLRRKLDLPGEVASLNNVRGVGFVLHAPE